MTDNPRRLIRERETLAALIRIFCRDRHGLRDNLCSDCGDLQAYALKRLDQCPFGEGKPICARCTVHCYKPSMRKRIREVMQHAGPRMLRRHPLLAMSHILDGRRKGAKTEK